MSYDTLIVGQGIAGTLLTHFLLAEGKTVMVIDNAHAEASSVVAAGLINPITGRRFVKSWEVDTLIPFAKETYQSLEQELGIRILYERNVAMLFNAIKVQNDWLVRSGDADVQAYISADFVLPFYQDFLKDVIGGVEFKGGRVDMKILLEAYREKLKKQEKYQEERFDYSQLEIKDNGVVYKDIKAEQIIFCEGYQAMQNPFFNYLPFNPAKGEVLWVRIPNYKGKAKMVKHGVFIVHLQDDLYWIGSSYLRDYEHIHPTEKEKTNLISRLRAVLKVPFELVKHEAAVRPTVRDRRPFIGQHPVYKPLYLFNGMGAKGSYLSPYFAQQFVSWLAGREALEKEVDINRYIKYYE